MPNMLLEISGEITPERVQRRSQSKKKKTTTKNIGRAIISQGLSALEMVSKLQLKLPPGDFPGGPVAKTPCSQCKGPELDPWSGN